MNPQVSKGVRRRREWIRRNPGGAGDYLRLTKKDRDRVDALFMAERKLKPNEVNSLVERLTDDRLSRRRTTNARDAALKNMRGRLSDRPRYRDRTVVANVGKKMTARHLKIAATASVDDLISLASIQEKGNPFWYH